MTSATLAFEDSGREAEAAQSLERQSWAEVARRFWAESCAAWKENFSQKRRLEDKKFSKKRLEYKIFSPKRFFCDFGA